MIAASATVPARGFAVLGVNTDTGKNGGAPVDYGWGVAVFPLSNSGGDAVLLLDAALNEVCRVEYDAGASWTLPIGASLVLKAPNLDPNDPLNWAVSTQRPPCFIGDAGDLGSPGGPNEVGRWGRGAMIMLC